MTNDDSLQARLEREVEALRDQGKLPSKLTEKLKALAQGVMEDNEARVVDKAFLRKQAFNYRSAYETGMGAGLSRKEARQFGHFYEQAMREEPTTKDHSIGELLERYREHMEVVLATIDHPAATAAKAAQIKREWEL